jgi:hypothetical protein
MGPQRAPSLAGEADSAPDAAERQAEEAARSVRAAPPRTGLIVDSGAAPDDATMTRDEFLRALRATAVEAASVGIGPAWSEAGCRYIERWFDLHAHVDARRIEELAARFSGLDRPATAAAYLPAIRQRLVLAIAGYLVGQDLSEHLAAAGLAGDVGRDPDGVAASSPGPTPTRFGPPVAPPAGPSMAAQLAASGAADGHAHEAVAGPLGASQRLDPAVAARLGGAFGASFDHVRVHTGPEAAATARRHGALALTVGRHVAFAPGRYRPSTVDGDALIAHELAHVLQQSSARGPVGAPPGTAHDLDADRAAAGALAQVHGRPTPGRHRPALSAPLSLQRCSDKRKINDPYALSVDALLRAKPPDLVGAAASIRGLKGAKAGDRALRDAIDEWEHEHLIDRATMFDWIALQELGEERSWPTEVKNFSEGAHRGLFTVSGLPPRSRDALAEYCLVNAGTAAGPATPEASYRIRFSAKWNIAPYAALPADFDPALDSKGPRNRRARKIFEDLYADPAVKSAYDNNAPAGFRNLCDTLVGPEGLNLLASPRLQALVGALGGPTVVAAGLGDAPYVALVVAVRPKAEALNPPDRAALGSSHSWRTLVDGKVSGPNDAVTADLRSDLWRVVTSSFPAAPPPPPVAPPAAEPAPVLTAGEKTFLGGVTITPPPAQNASDTAHPLPFDIKSAVPNPSLAARRRVVVEPENQVAEGVEDEKPWPVGSKSVPHTPKVSPDAGGPPSTVFTAKLTMPPVAADFPEKRASVTVTDTRLVWFRGQITHGATVMDENVRTGLAPGAVVPYFGGQLPFRVSPTLAPGTNPGLVLSMDGELKKNGVLHTALPRRGFPSGAHSSPLFDTILQQPAIAPVVNEKMELTIRFYSGAPPGVLVHTIVLPFEIAPALPPGADAAILAADTVDLNRPIAAPGTFLFDMFTSAPAGSPQALVAQAVAAGSLKVGGCIVRSDSAAWMTAHGKAGDLGRHVAYALGQVDDAHTMAAVSNAAGWRTAMFPDSVFLNLTPNIHNPGAKRSHAEMAGLLTHEGIHALDRRPSGDWGSYVTEFRAYWVMGMAAGASTAPDPTMSERGPKSPRARAIFDHLYGSPAYPFVQKAYDANTAGFRERVDNYLYPDGINLSLSVSLADLRKEIEGYTGAGYAAKRMLVAARHAALAAADKDQIIRNREWRDLVEDKFTGIIRVSWVPPKTKKEADDIKDLLGIPR